MAYAKHSLWSAITLMIVVMTLTLSIVLPIKAQADETPTLTVQEKIKVREEEENKEQKEDSSFKKQAKTLATQYEATAKQVASQGGDPKPLLDAAAYFTSQSK